jgi:hypothetical protein
VVSRDPNRARPVDVSDSSGTGPGGFLSLITKRQEAEFNQARTIAFVNGIDQTKLPVFQQSWWLNIARGAERYIEARVLRDGVVVGSLPYITKRNRLGIRWGASPSWCHFGGPVVRCDLSDAEKSEVLCQLVGQLPRGISFGFVCSPHSGDADLVRQAFLAAGFQHTVEATYSQSLSEADIMGRLARKHRLRIRSAAKALEITEVSAEEFIEFYRMNLAELAVSSYAPLDIAHNLIVKGQQLGIPQVRITAARRKAIGAPLEAAIACVWDTKRYYYWMSTRRRQANTGLQTKPHPDAIKVLIVDAMAHAAQMRLVFDADGFHTPGSRTLYKEILSIPCEEFRDAFTRTTWPARGHKALQRLQNLVAGSPDHR